MTVYGPNQNPEQIARDQIDAQLRAAGWVATLCEVRYYDYRTNIHHTLKRKPLRREDLDDFVACYSPTNRHQRKLTWDAEKNPEGRWRAYPYADLAARDKTSLDLFWLKDDSLSDLNNLPDPQTLAEEITETIESALENFRAVAGRLGGQLRS